MISASNAMSSAQAMDYYEKDYSIGDYYTKDGDNIPGQWQGKGAVLLGLSGVIEKADYLAVIHGKGGAKGVQLIQAPRKGQHQAGWDFTFSPDKSISIMALVEGDNRIIEAVERANCKAMEELEKFSMGKNADQQVVRTGNLVISTFRHESSRRKDPQLHFHNFIPNMTQRADGKWVSLRNQEMLRARTYCSFIAQAELGRELQKLGYEIGFTNKGSVYIKGVSRELCDEFSTRRKEIVAALKERGISGPQASAAMAILTRKPKDKNINKAVLIEGWKAISLAYGGDLHALLIRSKELSKQGGLQPTHEVIERSATEAVAFAKEHLSERNAVFLERDLEKAALRHGEGKVTLDDLRVAIAAEPKLVPAQDKSWPCARYTTTEAIRLESYVIQMAREGLGEGGSILKGKSYQPIMEELKSERGKGQREASANILSSCDNLILLEGKAGAGKTTMMNDVISWARAEGWAVRGFTQDTASGQVLQKDTGLETITLAALALEKTSPLFQSERQATMNLRAPQLWILDEAGKVSSKDMANLLEKGRQEGAKVIALGDTKQHRSVGAGSPFEYLQRSGLRAFRLDEIHRQSQPLEAVQKAMELARQDKWPEAIKVMENRQASRKAAPIPELGQALQLAKDGKHEEATEVLVGRWQKADALISGVKEASEGHTQKAFALFDKGGMVVEIKDAPERYRFAAQKYMEALSNKQTPVLITLTNQERVDLNKVVREEMIKAGKIEKPSFECDVRVSKRLTQAERKDARNYQVGDHLKFGTGSTVYGIEKGSEGRVVAVDREKNQVRVELTHGKTAEFNPARYNGGKMGDVSEVETRRVAVGDPLRYLEPTLPDGGKLNIEGARIANGQIGTVKELDLKTGQARVELDGGQSVVLELQKKVQPVDHAYAVTSFSSQGMTREKPIVLMDASHGENVLNKTSFHVNTSRSSQDLVIVTDDKEKLAAAVGREPFKGSALELAQAQKLEPEKQVAREGGKIPTYANWDLDLSKPRGEGQGIGRDRVGEGGPIRFNVDFERGTAQVVPTQPQQPTWSLDLAAKQKAEPAPILEAARGEALPPQHKAEARPPEVVVQGQGQPPAPVEKLLPEASLTKGVDPRTDLEKLQIAQENLGGIVDTRRDLRMPYISKSEAAELAKDPKALKDAVGRLEAAGLTEKGLNPLDLTKAQGEAMSKAVQESRTNLGKQPEHQQTQER